MKLNFEWKNDGKPHQYCENCHAETVNRIKEGEKTLYSCSTCHGQYERSIVIDPAIKWWVDDTNEYWHESSGVFIRDQASRFLFFERVIFPFALTIPSGHVDVDEDAMVAARREVIEEVGINLKNINEVATDDVWGDQCRRGADVHRWHAFVANLEGDNAVTLNHEGVRPQWLTLEEALDANITPPVRYMIEHHKELIEIE